MRGLMKDLDPGTYMIVAKAGAEKTKGQSLQDELVELLKKR